MTIPDNILSELEDAFNKQRLESDRVEETFNIRRSQAGSTRKAHVDPKPLVDNLPDDDRARRRRLLGYARGIKHVLMEPERSDADSWGFVESAGGLLPSIEIPTFVDGVEAAADKPAWTVDFPGDVVVCYFIQLDRGLRVLTEAQVEQWGVSDDRITAGARSILFHKTRNLDFVTFDDFDGVHRLRAGDGYDASRCFVVSDVFYSELDQGFRFALPSPDHFLCVFDDSPEMIDELSRAAISTYREADIPLTPHLFEFDVSSPVISKELSDE